MPDLPYQVARVTVRLLVLAVLGPLGAAALPKPPHDPASNVTCGDCHVPYVGINDPDATGYGAVETKCKSCHNPLGRAAAHPAVGLHLLDAGAAYIGCGKCHDPHNLEPNSGRGNGLVRKNLRWPTARAAVVFPSGGANPFVAGAPGYNGICEVCHTRTAHFRNDGSAPDQAHTSADLSGNDCTGCHGHGRSFESVCQDCHERPPSPLAEEYAGGGGAHARHVALGYGCSTCHLDRTHNEGLGTVLQANVDVNFAEVRFPGGTTATGGGAATQTPSANPTCSVGCHNPVVGRSAAGLANTATWTDPTLGCGDCHDRHAGMAGQPVDGKAQLSRHIVSASETDQRADCARCHTGSAEHMAGLVEVKTWGGASQVVQHQDPNELTGFCYACHDGSGGSFGQRAGPTVTSFYSTSGDWHGTRSGSGFGGTLKAPYYRGYGPIPCATCHEPHSSPAAALIRSEVNGNPITGPIHKAGSGAEQLCLSCHEGNYHAGCQGSGCHPGAYTAADPVPPPQSCWYCHYHGGIRHWRDPNNDCDHCHASWFPKNLHLDTTPPAITSGPTVQTLSTGITIRWNTSEAATNWVEFGLAECCTDRRGHDYRSTSHGVNLTGLVPEATYRFRVSSTDVAGNTALSPVQSFFVPATEPPPAPTLIDEAAVGSTVPVVVTLEWNAVTDPNGDPVEYQAQIDTDPAFGSVDQTGPWSATRTWTLTVAPGRHYWRVRARDAAHPSYTSAWSATSAFSVMSSSPPPAPALVDEPDFDSGGSTSMTFVLQWNAVVDPDGDPVQYRVVVDDQSSFSSLSADSGWITGQSYTVTLPGWGYTWYWKVMARDANHPEGVSAWSTVDSFADLYKGSCPFLYAWDGTEYRYVTDLQGPVLGLPAGSIGSKMVTLYQPHHVVLDFLRPVSGEYRLKLRGALPEIDYLDELTIMVVDHPPGYELTTTTAASTYQFGYVDPFRIWTLYQPVLPSRALDDDGRDVLAQISARDGVPAPAENEPDEVYEVTFPPPARPEHAKLVIDGWSFYGPHLRYGTTEQGWVEVVDTTGDWVEVAKIPPPAGDEKTVVVDLSGAFRTQNYSVRIHLGWRSGARWVIDRVRLDDSAPISVNVTEVAVGAADLSYRGALSYQGATFERRITASDDVVPDFANFYGSGAFTRYGDVRPLLTQTDDMFVIMNYGDELSLSFPEPPPPAAGLSRTVLLRTKNYYKDAGGSGAWTVDPLPFQGMSAYPYPEDESYPTDPAHQQYQLDYNTRIVP